MAKNIRWQVTFKSLNGTTYYVNIYDNDWPAGVVMPVRGATDPFYFEENNSDDLLNSVLRYRTGYIRVIEDSFGDLNDIYPSSKFDRYVECVTGNTVVFNGYIQVQDFQRPLTPGPRTLELPVISPLGLFNECAFNPITPPETTTLGELLDMTLGAGTYTKVVFPIITGAELGKKIFSLVVSPWNTDFHHSMTVDAYHKVMKPETYAYLVEGICKAFGWICHDTPQALVFTSFDHFGLYASYPKGHIGESGEQDSESVSQTEEPITDHYTPADANASMHKLLPDTGIEVGYEGDFGRMKFTFDRALYNGVETFPGMTPDDGEMWSVCNFYPVQQLYEFSAASNVGFDQDGHVTRGPHCVAWNGNIGLLYSLFGSTDYDGQTLFTIRHYTKKRTGDRWAVTFKGMTSNDGNGGYVYTIGALKDDDKVTEYYVQAEKTIYDDYIEVAFKYHFDNVSGSVYPQLPAYTLIFIYDIQFEYIENEELYAEYRFAPAEDSDELPSSIVHPVISSSVTMPFSMYRLNDHMIGDTLLSAKLTEYPYLFQERMEMEGKFRGTSIPDLYHAMMWGYMSKKWRIIAMGFHPWDDEYILTMQSSPLLDGSTHTITASAANTSLDGYSDRVNDGTSFSHLLSAITGYSIASVAITMGGVDITSTAYNSSTGQIYIASVTGNVVITVVAEVAPVLPYDAEVEYLGTDGNAYINIGIKAASTLQFNIDMYLPSSTVNSWAFGGRYSSSQRMLCVLFDVVTSGKVVWRFGNTTNNCSAISAGNYNLNNMTAVRTLQVNGSSYNATNSTFSTDAYIYLFTCNNNNNGIVNPPLSGMRFIKGKFYSSGTLVRDFIPVRIGQVGYLYDKVSGDLYGNASGSGAFTFGNDKNS